MVASRISQVLQAGAVAAIISGAPSTVATVADQWRRPDRDLAALRSALLVSTRAAGTLAGRPTLPAGVAVHLAVSGWWAAVLAATLPPGHRAATGAVAGLAIAALDLGLLARRYPAIRALGSGRQAADHLLFGVVFGATLDHLSNGRP